MGRFETTVPYYARYREPYPPAFFATLAERLALTGSERLLDLGCGPGLLSLGFAPYVGEVTGVDPEPAMLEAARRTVAGERVRFIEGTAEALPDDIGSFRLITIGRALHWMDRERTLATLGRVLDADGTILICGAHTDAAATPWYKTYREARSPFTDESVARHSARDIDAWFAGSAFAVTDRIVVGARHSIAVPDLVGRCLSMSSSSPAVVGARVAMLRIALDAALGPFLRDGRLEETYSAVATLIQRR